MEGAGGRNHGAVRISFRRGTGADPSAAAELWLRPRKAAIGAIPEPAHDDVEVRAWFASHVVLDIELWVAEDGAGTLVGIRSWKGDGTTSSTWNRRSPDAASHRR